MPFDFSDFKQNNEETSLFTAVGFVTVQWGHCEQSLEVLVNILHNQYGGKHLQRRTKIPRPLSEKIAFVKECSTQLSSLSPFRSELNALVYSFDLIKQTRHDLIHGALTDEPYDLPKEDDISLVELLIPLEVTYQQDRPIVSFFDNHNTKFEKQFLIKGKDWEYEQEERVFDRIRQNGIHRYDQNRILYSVIAGMKMKNNNYSKTNKIINEVNCKKNLNVTLHKVSPVPGKYELCVTDRPDFKIS